MSREILARLTARGIDMTSVGRSTLKPDNLAYLLSGLRRGPLYLCQWLDLGEEAAKNRLLAELHDVLPHMRMIKIWNKSNGQLAKLIDLSLSEISSPNVCRVCNGRRVLIVDALHVECKACLGTGFGGLSGRDRARFVGVDESTWRECWRNRYRDVLSVLIAYDSTITSHVRRRLLEREKTVDSPPQIEYIVR